MGANGRDEKGTGLKASRKAKAASSHRISRDSKRNSSSKESELSFLRMYVLSHGNEKPARSYERPVRAERGFSSPWFTRAFARAACHIRLSCHGLRISEPQEFACIGRVARRPSCYVPLIPEDGSAPACSSAFGGGGILLTAPGGYPQRRGTALPFESLPYLWHAFHRWVVLIYGVSGKKSRPAGILA